MTTRPTHPTRATPTPSGLDRGLRPFATVNTGDSAVALHLVGGVFTTPAVATGARA